MMTHKFLNATNFIQYIFNDEITDGEREEARAVIDKFNTVESGCCNSSKKFKVQDLDEVYREFVLKLEKVGPASKLIEKLFKLLNTDRIEFDSENVTIVALNKQTYAKSQI